MNQEQIRASAKIGARVEAQIWDQVRAQRAQTEDQVRILVWAEVETDIWVQIHGEVRLPIWAQTREHFQVRS